jgi:hypothetical protein
MYYTYLTHKLNTPHSIIATPTKSPSPQWYNYSKTGHNQSHYTKSERTSTLTVRTSRQIGKRRSRSRAQNCHSPTWTCPCYPILLPKRRMGLNDGRPRPNKGPIRFLEKQSIKYDRENNLENMATHTPNIHKWTWNAEIDKELSNEFWENPEITDKQKIMPHQIPNRNLYGCKLGNRSQSNRNHSFF